VAEPAAPARERGRVREPVAPTRVRTAYLICATPRSGSTLLCEALANTGVAGRPEEYYQHRRKTGLPRRPREYFESAHIPEVERILGDYARVDDEPSLFDPRRFATYADYIDWTVERATTPNGIFGAKVMWAYFGGFLSRLRELPGRDGAPDAALVPSLFPNIRYVFVTRADKARQAVSLWRALQTWTWRRDRHDDSPPRGTLTYSYAGIDHLRRSIEEEERCWHAYFDEAGVTPRTIVYEHLAVRYEDTAADVVRYLGLEPASVRMEGRRQMRRQADALSAEWVTRYRADAAARANGRPPR
jgi:trehalose 2-sulfotransferase